MVARIRYLRGSDLRLRGSDCDSCGADCESGVDSDTARTSGSGGTRDVELSVDVDDDEEVESISASGSGPPFGRGVEARERERERGGFVRERGLAEALAVGDDDAADAVADGASRSRRS